jgi:hypothetical protein
MRKISVLLILVSVWIVLLFGCNRKNNANQQLKPTPTTQNQGTEPKEDADDKSDEADDEDSSTARTDLKNQSDYEGATVLISNNNPHTFTSTIPLTDDLVSLSYELDKQLESLLVNENYTFDKPMVIVNPFGISPLTALVLFNTEQEYGVRVTVKGNTEATDVVGKVDAKTHHRVPVIGLYPGKNNTVILELIDKNGKTIERNSLSVQTDPLPKSMQDLVKLVKSSGQSAYGMLEVSGFGNPRPFAFDTEGNIRWYLNEEYASYGYFPLSNNRFIVMDKDVMIQTYEKPHAQQLYEMDYLGRVYQIYFVKNGAHHEIIEKTPGGNLLVCTNSINGHVEDMIQEIDRKTGAIVKSLDLREVFGDSYVDMLDWAHVNSVQYIKEDDSVVLSPRNIHSAIKVDWSGNELKWIICDPEFWEGTPFEEKLLKPVGDIIWNYQQHSAYQLDEDLDNDPDTIHVMMFDNHWHGTRKINFFDKLKSSYVSIFTINEKDMTISQPHSYEGIKSKITSNYRFDYKAGRVFFMGGYLAEETEDGQNGMIYEFDYETEKIINQYSTKNTFYRAYEFVPDFNSCASALVPEDNYFKGTLSAAVLNANAQPVPDKTLTEGIKLSVSQQLLYVEANDHKVSHIEFIGNKNSYMLDLSYTDEGESKYAKLSYKLLAPFSNLPPDDYKLVITYEGVRYNTGHTISIQP